MSKLKIAIIISTTRAARFGHKPAQWIQDIAAGRDDMETEIVDLRDFPMPFFDEVASNAWVPSQNPVAQRWQKKVAEVDGSGPVPAEPPSDTESEVDVETKPPADGESAEPSRAPGDRRRRSASRPATTPPRS